MPTYPSVARAAHLDGVVIVKLTVGADGAVIAAEPLSPGSARFLINRHDDKAGQEMDVQMRLMPAS